jgi:pimeloyl-ACP methyl ester carboxylesterase
VRERFASFDGLEIAFDVRGAGPDVLCMHGFAADAAGNWVAPGVADAIAAAGRRVILYDARGHGASGKPHDPASYADQAMVRDARALLDYLAIEAAAVVGYSMGAIVATRLVPLEDRTRSLVLGGVGRRLATGPPLNRAAIADALSAPAGAPISDASARAFRQFAQRSGNDLEALAAIQRVRGHADPGPFDQIRVPTLVVVGEGDALAGPPDELAARIPNAVARVVPGDHLSAVAQPEFTAAIVDFLTSV